MSLSNNFPTVGPVLNLDFLNSGVLDPRITFTRASTATYFNQLGVLQTAQNNVARFDYNPSTLAAQGFLIEEARTNSIRNNTMQGAVAGTPGTLPTNWSTFTALTGLTRTVVSTGTENGITYVDIRVNGTPSAGGVYGIYFEASNQVAAVSGQNWSNSAYLKLAGGSLSGISSVNFVVAELNNIGGFLNSSTTAVIPTSAALSTQRVVVSRTFNQATTAFALPYVDLVLSGVAIDITLRIGLPQLEQGAFATSVIPTTTTALTRSADVASMTGTNFSSWYNAAAGTIFARGQTNSNTNSACLLSIDDTTTNNRIQLRRGFAGPTSGLRMVSSGGSIDVTLVTGTATGVNSIAVAATASDQNAASNGTLFTGIVSITPMPTVTRMLIGDGPASTVLNGYIQRISYYNYRVSNAQLQALTGS